MKKFCQKMDSEILWSGIFGGIAVIATIIELLLNGVNAANIVSAIKDISGTLAVIFVLVITLKHLIIKEPTNFDEVFEKGMETLSQKYTPLLEKQSDGKHKYYIASKLSAINDNSTGAYHKFFDLTNNQSIELATTKTVFVGMGGSDELYKAIKSKIALSVGNKISAYDIVEKCEITTNGIKIIFKEPLTTTNHANQLVDIIDCVLLTFITEYKRT